MAIRGRTFPAPPIYLRGSRALVIAATIHHITVVSAAPPRWQQHPARATHITLLHGARPFPVRLAPQLHQVSPTVWRAIVHPSRAAHVTFLRGRAVPPAKAAPFTVRLAQPPRQDIRIPHITILRNPLVQPAAKARPFVVLLQQPPQQPTARDTRITFQRAPLATPTPPPPKPTILLAGPPRRLPVPFSVVYLRAGTILPPARPVDPTILLVRRPPTPGKVVQVRGFVPPPVFAKPRAPIIITQVGRRDPRRPEGSVLFLHGQPPTPVKSPQPRVISQVGRRDPRRPDGLVLFLRAPTTAHYALRRVTPVIVSAIAQRAARRPDQAALFLRVTAPFVWQPSQLQANLTVSRPFATVWGIRPTLDVTVSRPTAYITVPLGNPQQP